MSLISVIVPVFNVERYLFECIESILSQTFKNFELILIDDGSHDNCSLVCDKFSLIDSRIKVIHQINGGVSLARNHGLDLSFINKFSEWVSFIDGDDSIEKNFLEYLLNIVIKDNSMVVQCSFSNCIFPTSFCKRYSGRQASLEMLTLKPKIDITFDFSVCNKLFKKSIFNCIRFSNGKRYEDMTIIPHILYYSDIVSITSEKLYNYRVHNNSFLHLSFNNTQFMMIEACDSWKNSLPLLDDKELSLLIKKIRNVFLCKIVISAYESKKENNIPSEYRISKYIALFDIFCLTSKDTFEYYLAKLYPWLAIMYARCCRIIKYITKGE